MSGISTHILDVALGRPAAGVRVMLERAVREDHAAVWVPCASATTDADGRIKPLLEAEKVVAGTHRLIFATAEYFSGLHQATLYPEVLITFAVEAAGGSYHIPLLLSPFGYTTYRGT